MIVDARLESARHRFPEISFKDLEVTQTGIDRWSFTDRNTGVEYRRAEVDPLFSNDLSHIAAFTIDAAGKVHFLRRRANAGVVSG
jgi:hypothetical protein